MGNPDGDHVAHGGGDGDSDDDGGGSSCGRDLVSPMSWAKSERALKAILEVDALQIKFRPRLKPEGVYWVSN